MCIRDRNGTLTVVEACPAGAECNACLECGVSSAETCDGWDNDCDGEIDEGFDLGGSCTIGACDLPGTYVCAADGSGVHCSAVEACAEQAEEEARGNQENETEGGDNTPTNPEEEEEEEAEEEDWEEDAVDTPSEENPWAVTEEEGTGNPESGLNEEEGTGVLEASTGLGTTSSNSRVTQSGCRTDSGIPWNGLPWFGLLLLILHAMRRRRVPLAK